MKSWGGGRRTGGATDEEFLVSTQCCFTGRVPCCHAALQVAPSVFTAKISMFEMTPPKAEFSE